MGEPFPIPDGFKPQTPRTGHDPGRAARSQRKLEEMAEKLITLFEWISEEQRQILIEGVLQECPCKWREWLGRMSPDRLEEVQLFTVLGLFVVVRSRSAARRQPETPTPEANDG